MAKPIAKTQAITKGAAAFALLPLLACLAQPAKAEPAPTAQPIKLSHVGARSAPDQMHYVDAALRPFPHDDTASLDANIFVQTMREAKQAYLDEWASLPDEPIAPGPIQRPGDRGPRVTAVQTRLGLEPSGEFDSVLSAAIAKYRKVHGLTESDRVDSQLIASLNSGHGYYIGLIDRNIERASEIPQDLPGRFVWVDITKQQLAMFEDGTQVGAMQVIVGKTSMPTPALAAYIRHAEVRPVWNLPPDLVRHSIAPKAVRRGASYIGKANYRVLSDYGKDAMLLDPKQVDWRSVVAGEKTVRIVQEPGPYNAMGDIKFMFPNHLGIYMHDTPQTELFEHEQRLFSAGCVRLEDADQLAQWLFETDILGADGHGSSSVELQAPVPVFMTYFTFWPGTDGALFRPDIYGHDENLTDKPAHSA